MKKSLLLCIAALSLIASSCNNSEPAPDPSSKLKFRVEFNQLSAQGSNIVERMAWAQGDKIAILPLEAKASPALADGKAAAFEASTSTESSMFVSNGTNFYPESSIQKHKFAFAYPYCEAFATDGSDLKPSADQTVSAPGFIVKDNIPFFCTTEISTPSAGATVLARMSAMASVVGIPVPADFGPVDKVVLKNDSAAVVTVTVTSDKAGSLRYVYAAIEAGEYSALTATLTPKTGEALEIVLDAATVSKGYVCNLVDVTPEPAEVYSINLEGLNFADSQIYDAKDSKGNIVAIVCREYLGKDVNQQAVTVYGTKPGKTSRVMDSENPVCLVAKILKSAPKDDYTNYAAPEGKVHGGIFSFKSDNTGYVTYGKSDSLNVVYAEMDTLTSVTTISSKASWTPMETVLTPRTLVLSDRGETKAYKLAKIWRLIWMTDNLMTAKYNDGTDIPKASKAAELQNAAADSYVYVNTSCHAYNGDAVLTGKLGTADGWGVPSKTDVQNLYTYCGTVSSTLNSAQSNISGFSNRFKGRVLSKWESDYDPCYWCSNAKDTDNKMQCLVIRMAGTAPTISAQSYKYGHWVRLKHTLY